MHLQDGDPGIQCLTEDRGAIPRCRMAYDAGVVSDVDQNTIKEKMEQIIEYEKVYEVIRQARQNTDDFFAKYGI